MTDSVIFQKRLTTRLLVWSALSVVAGAILQWAAAPFWRAFGQQGLGWGVIDAGIALLGQRGLTRKLARGYPASEQIKDTRMLRRVLWVNAGLDVLYVAGGLKLMDTGGRRDERARGHGAGIVLQGAFLLIFDLVHAVLARRILRGSL